MRRCFMLSVQQLCFRVKRVNSIRLLCTFILFYWINWKGLISIYDECRRIVCFNIPTNFNGMRALRSEFDTNADMQHESSIGNNVRTALDAFVFVLLWIRRKQLVGIASIQLNERGREGERSVSLITTCIKSFRFHWKLSAYGELWPALPLILMQSILEEVKVHQNRRIASILFLSSKCKPTNFIEWFSQISTSSDISDFADLMHSPNALAILHVW